MATSTSLRGVCTWGHTYVNVLYINIYVPAAPAIGVLNESSCLRISKSPACSGRDRACAVLFRVSSCVCLHWARARVVGMLVRGGSSESLMLPCIERWHPPLKTNNFLHSPQEQIVHTPSHPTTRHIPLSNNASNVGPPTSNSICSYTWFALPVHSAQRGANSWQIFTAPVMPTVTAGTWG